MESEWGKLISSVSVDEYEEFICGIEGILAARIVMPQPGVIEELHIVSDRSRHPKQIVRDIQSAMQARYHIAIDHKVISIAQMEEKKQKHFFGRNRLARREVVLRVSDNIAEARVVLSLEGHSFEGTAKGANTVFSRPRVIATAVLDAVHKYLDREDVFALVDVKKTTVADATAYMVAVSCISPAGTDLLLGSAQDPYDESNCVVKAMLSAINRRLSLIESS